MNWPNEHKQLSSAIQKWHQLWNVLSKEESDTNTNKRWEWILGKWMEYSNKEGSQLGEVPYPIFVEHIDKEIWQKLKTNIERVWGKPILRNHVQYNKYGGELILLPNGKQFVQRKDIHWVGRYGSEASIVFLQTFECKNERFPVEQYFDQRIEMETFMWERQGIHYLLTECLEEQGDHWFQIKTSWNEGSPVPLADWKQWCEWCGQESRSEILPLWGKHELKLSGQQPFITFALV